MKLKIKILQTATGKITIDNILSTGKTEFYRLTINQPRKEQSKMILDRKQFDQLHTIIKEFEQHQTT